VGLCLLPIRVDEQSGSGVPGGTLYFMPLAAGPWGGHKVKEESAAQGRQLAQQLLANPAGAIVAFNMQGGWVGGWGRQAGRGAGDFGSFVFNGGRVGELLPSAPVALLLTALALHCRRLSLPTSAGLLHLLGEGGVAVPPPHHLLLVDPRLLAWLLEPQLLQVGGRPARAGWSNSCRLLFERFLTPSTPVTSEIQMAACACPAAFFSDVLSGR
jgi:hypothetical protein